MKPESLLKLAYVANLVILTPVLLSLFFGDNRTTLPVFGHVVKESEGLRLLVGSLWFAILACSAVGLFFPRAMAAILLLQVIYKSLWLVIFVLPRLLAGQAALVPWGPALTFLPIVLFWPLILWQAWGNG